jgi:4-hydroxybenzoate polyprenyltransferase
MQPSVARQVSLSGRIRAHVAIARVDHWIKNVFVLPGIVIPISVSGLPSDPSFLKRLLIGLAGVSLITSSNYVINEVLDGPLDKLHPTKKNRPVPSGRVDIPIAYVQWLAIMLVGLALTSMVSWKLTAVSGALWVMGCLYNIPPVRTKDLAYLDVITESVNNPLRLLAGWYITTDTLVAPLSLIISYWMVGCYFMALKRFSEYRELGKVVAAAYRRSFRFYSERSILVSVMFYAAVAMLFFGAFIIRYRIELALSFPMVAAVMAIYYDLAFDEHSAVQNPEHLYKEKKLMIATVLCVALMIGLLFVNLPALSDIFAPTLPTGR